MKPVVPFTGFRRRYGAAPMHLVAHLLAFAIAAFALDRTVSGGDAKLLVGWYLGLIVAHDLILVPAYAGLDCLVRTVLARIPARRAAGVPMINHVRVPALISGLLLLIYAPLISGLSEPYYVAFSGHHLEHYVRNWVGISAALFAGSAGLYGLRRWRARSDRPAS
ncbi:MAG: hypothetical protein ACRDKL_06340 [Solirubrobacteraceae bacterium]